MDKICNGCNLPETPDNCLTWLGYHEECRECRGCGEKSRPGDKINWQGYHVNCHICSVCKEKSISLGVMGWAHHSDCQAPLASEEEEIQPYENKKIEHSLICLSAQWEMAKKLIDALRNARIRHPKIVKFGTTMYGNPFLLAMWQDPFSTDSIDVRIFPKEISVSTHDRSMEVKWRSPSDVQAIEKVVMFMKEQHTKPE